LEKMSNEFDYPNKVKSMMDELKSYKERVKELEDKIKKDEKTSIQVQEHMVRLEENGR